MTRLEAMRAAMTRYPHKKHADKLKADELRLIEEFIARNDSLDRSAFEMAANRWFLDKEKPRNWLTMLQLVVVANITHGRKE